MMPLASALRRARPNRRALIAFYESACKRDLAISRAIASTALFCALLCLALIFATLSREALNVADQDRAAKAEFLASLQQPRGDRSATRDPSESRPENPFVGAETETLAAAEVDSLLRKIVMESNGAILSSRAEPKHVDAGHIHKIEAEISLEGRIEAIQAALFALETAAPFIFIKALELHPANEASDKAGADPAPVLRATLTASAYWKGPV